MRALLLAAGLGTRLRPITETIPKCLVPINGRPLIDYWLRLLGEGGITRILVNTHYFADTVRAHLAHSEYARYVTTVYEDKLLGTAGTLLKNRRFFADEPIMLVHADNLSLFDMAAFIERFETRDSPAEITMMTFTTTSPDTCGIIELDDRGMVRAFHEKVRNPPGNIANAAVYILSPGIFRFLDKIGKVAIDFSTEVLPEYIGRMNTFHNDVYHRDIGTPESLQAARKEYPDIERKYWKLARLPDVARESRY